MYLDRIITDAINLGYFIKFWVFKTLNSAQFRVSNTQNLLSPIKALVL